MNSVTVFAPAKINWTLDILGTDERGYHILDMLMQRITLCDGVAIKKAKEGIRLSSNKGELACDESNTAFKAARLFFDKTKIHAGCEIFIEKKIPSGAGLAGGSADGAAVLRGLNVLFSEPLKEEELEALALKIGADVPFMLKDGLYRAKGIGEQLTKIPIEKAYALLLVMDENQPAETRAVYKEFDKTGTDASPKTDAFITALKNGEVEKFASLGGNALTKSACKIAPNIKKNIENLKNTDAQFVSMTGSGSVVFGVYETLAQAKQAEKQVGSCWHCVCETTAQGLKIKENG